VSIQTVYDYAQDGYWAYTYLKLTFFVVLIFVAVFAALAPDESDVDIQVLSYFSMFAIATGLALAAYSHADYSQNIAAPSLEVSGPMEEFKINGGGGGRRGGGLRVHFCVDGVCFADSSTENAFKSSGWVRSGLWARVRYTNGWASQLNADAHVMLKIEIERPQPAE
jgi:hypothetical protein